MGRRKKDIQHTKSDGARFEPRYYMNALLDIYYESQGSYNATMTSIVGSSVPQPQDFLTSLKLVFGALI
jgi:hypothetical protein